LSLIFVTSCNIAIPAVTNNGIIMKDISGLHHSLDWDRMQSCICTIFDMDSMQAPINEGQLTISTRPPARNGESITVQI
jgi:hypothetical protein